MNKCSGINVNSINNRVRHHFLRIRFYASWRKQICRYYEEAQLEAADTWYEACGTAVLTRFTMQASTEGKAWNMTLIRLYKISKDDRT